MNTLTDIGYLISKVSNQKKLCLTLFGFVLSTAVVELTSVWVLRQAFAAPAGYDPFASISWITFYALLSVATVGFTYGATLTGQLIVHNMSLNILSEISVSKRQFRDDTANVINLIITETTRISNQVLTPLVQIFVRSVSLSVICVYVYLLNKNAIYFLVGGASLFASYAIIVRPILGSVGIKITNFNKSRAQVILDLLGNELEIKGASKQSSFIGKFDSDGKVWVRSQALSYLIGLLPRSIFEIVTVLCLLITLYFTPEPSDLFSLQTIFLVSLVFLKVIPAAQMLNTMLSIYQTNRDSVSVFRKITNKLDLPKYSQSLNRAQLDCVKRITPAKLVKVTNPNSQPRSKCLGFEPNKIYSITGPSGSGKSVFLKEMLGYGQHKLEFSTDGSAINPSLFLVSQHPTVIHGNLYENVKLDFFVNEEELKEIDVICKKLAIDYLKTKSKEELQNLSSGELQRLNIARGLFLSPDILLLDECTSNLDIDLERVVFSALRQQAKRSLIIMVNHRETAINLTDQVLEITAVQNELNLRFFGSKN